MENRFWLAFAAFWLATAVQGQTLVGQAFGAAPFANPSGDTILELWGTHGEYAPANVAAAPPPGLTGMAVQSEGIVFPLINQAGPVSVGFRYNLGAAPLSTTIRSDRVSASYPAQSLSAVVKLMGADAQFSNDVTRVVTRVNSTTNQLSLGRAANTVEGAIFPADLSIPGRPDRQFRFDLGLYIALGSSTFKAGLDPSRSLVVRLVEPDAYRAVGLYLDLFGASLGVPLAPSLPTRVDGATYDLGGTLTLAIDGVFQVDVNRFDYGPPEDYLYARDWVAENVRQFNIEMYATWNIDQVNSQLVPVPEPSSWALLLLGGVGVLCRSRRPAS